MTDERRDSLASQAASWVPPWERGGREPDREYQAAATPPDLDDDDPAVTVDDPAGESADDPTAIGVGPDLPEPASVSDAAEVAEAEDDLEGEPVDAPQSPDGDDAGDVFDHAADDDLSDDAEDDVPFAEEPAAVAEGLDAVAVETATPAVGKAAADKATEKATEKAAASIPSQVRKAGSERTAEEVDPEPEPVPMDDDEMRAALEAILLVVDEPVGELQLAQILEQPAERIALVLDDISARYTAAGHGFDLRRAAGGWRLYTRPEYAAYVERFVLDGQSVRLTQAALETLAVVAYKQPVTRSRISAIRGVNCDGVMRTLATRGLIEECGTEPETGAHLYRTTGLFLEKLGLNSVDQLPPLAPFLPDDVEEVLDASG